ncbi:hypothetical protein LLG07_01245 [bacterium]|jgi:hypothetical protein|nr:hypothetical protein [bacterium]
MKHIIDLKTGNTIEFSVFKDDEKALKYAKSRKLSIINEDGQIEGGLNLPLETLEKINEMLNTKSEIKEEGKPKRKKKDGIN